MITALHSGIPLRSLTRGSILLLRWNLINRLSLRLGGVLHRLLVLLLRGRSILLRGLLLVCSGSITLIAVTARLLLSIAAGLPARIEIN